MRERTYSQKIKIRVEKLRASGVTYGQITASFGIPKSTLSYWLGKKFPGVFDKEARLLHLGKIREIALIRKKEIRAEQDHLLKTRVEKEFASFPTNDTGYLKSILAALYWAEGSKHKGVSGVNFVNTDPLMLSFYVKLLRRCYIIDESKFRVRLHIHHYHKRKIVKKFWSELLGVPINQFGKIYLKKRSKTKRFRKNFMGICIVKYSNSNIRKEVLEICRNLATLKL